jgi:putative colanic acid biosynthesis UDP-glucose lipid carrier transferase
MIYELAQNAEKNFIRFMFVPDLKLFVNRTIHFNYLEDIPILSLRSEPLQDVAGQIKKRFFDIVFSLMVILLLLSWLLPILAILIKLDSKGPVFFVQMRSGKNNRSFRCYKFRSLRINNDADSTQVTQNDVRFTRLGKILRRTNIDEFPQFFNTLIGDMSIVGPRPHMLKHTELYSGLLNQYMVRHFLKPGITGWAQVNGLRGETKTISQMQQRVEHDIWYIENWSLWLDFRIIILTVYNAIRGEKNAF